MYNRSAAMTRLLLVLVPLCALGCSSDGGSVVTAVTVPSEQADPTVAKAAAKDRGYLTRGSIADMVYSPDGRRLILLTTTGTWFYDASQLEPVCLLENDREVLPVAFSSDGRSLATIHSDLSVHLWSLTNCDEQADLEFAKDVGLDRLAFSPDLRTVAVGHRDGTVHLWNTSNGNEEATWKGDGSDVDSIAFSRDGRTLATAHESDAIWLRNVDNGEIVARFEMDPTSSSSLAFSADGQTLAAGVSPTKLLDIRTGELRGTLNTVRNWYLDVVFSPDGRLVLARDAGSLVRLVCDMSSGEMRFRVGDDGPVPHRLSFTWDSRFLAVIALDGTLEVWDTERGERKTRVDKPADLVSGIALSPDGRTLAFVSDDSLVLWDVTAAQIKSTVEMHP